MRTAMLRRECTLARGVFWGFGRHMFQSPLAVLVGLRPILNLT